MANYTPLPAINCVCLTNERKDDLMLWVLSLPYEINRYNSYHLLSRSSVYRMTIRESFILKLCTS